MARVNLGDDQERALAKVKTFPSIRYSPSIKKIEEVGPCVGVAYSFLRDWSRLHEFLEGGVENLKNQKVATYIMLTIREYTPNWLQSALITEDEANQIQKQSQVAISFIARENYKEAYEEMKDISVSLFELALSRFFHCMEEEKKKLYPEVKYSPHILPKQITDLQKSITTKENL